MAIHTLTEAMGTGYISPSSWGPAAVPGDTIIIAADRVSGILLKDFNGTPASPYLFTNPTDSKVTLDGIGTTSWGLQGFNIFDSDNFKILGNNYASETYGIEINGITNTKSGIRLWRCADWEIAYIYIHYTRSGISQNNNDPWTQANSMGSCRVHHNYISDTDAIYSEGMYLGKSITGDHPQWTRMEIDHNYVYRTGSDGIQAGQSAEILIHDNYLEDLGVRNDLNQNLGITISVEGAGIEIYRNTVIRSRHNGIVVNSTCLGNPSIHDNVVWDAGYGGAGNGIKINSIVGAADIVNNTVVDSDGYGIKTDGMVTSGSILYNLLVENGLGGISSPYIIQNDNRESVSIAAENFGNAGIGNFRLTLASPARDAGVGPGYSTVDFDENTRPYGLTDPDIGAFEFMGLGTTPTSTTLLPTTTLTTPVPTTAPPALVVQDIVADFATTAAPTTAPPTAAPTTLLPTTLAPTTAVPELICIKNLKSTIAKEMRLNGNLC